MDIFKGGNQSRNQSHSSIGIPYTLLPALVQTTDW
jgi:hypothetical protein